MRKASRALTLLEVLAAVAILGLLYTTLAGSAMQGLRSEGTSKRRLEASQVADRALTELEIGLDGGAVPPVGQEEYEVEPYRVVVSVESFVLPVPSFEGGQEAEAPLLADLAADKTSPLRAIEVRVTWFEGENEFEVVRTTFALDLASLDTSALAPPAEDPAAGGPEAEAER